MGFSDLKDARKPTRNRFDSIPKVQPLQTSNLSAPEIAPVADRDPEPEELASQAQISPVRGGVGAAEREGGGEVAAPPMPRPPGTTGPGTTGSGAARARPEPEGRVDGRSLRATGRTEQLNVKVRPDIKARFLRHAQREGKVAAVLLEQWIESLPE